MISSHVLRDVERIVDWIVCLERGRLVVDSALDDLQERYAEWRVTSAGRKLPARFTEPFVRRQRVNGSQAHLIVEQAEAGLDPFRRRHRVEVTSIPMNLERILPLLLGGRER